MKYPRVKSINWFSVNTLKRVENPERRLNNFSLSENRKVLSAYQKMIEDPYFLSSVTQNNAASRPNNAQIKRMVAISKRTLTGKIDGHAWIKTYDPYISKVVYRLNGKQLSTVSQYPFRYTIDMNTLKKGAQSLEVIVYDSKNRQAVTKTYTFTK
jgi:hypothetical protein